MTDPTALSLIQRLSDALGFRVLNNDEYIPGSDDEVLVDEARAYLAQSKSEGTMNRGAAKAALDALSTWGPSADCFTSTDTSVTISEEHFDD
jgi:hypothetical protein